MTKHTRYTVEASIGITNATKTALSEVKPGGLSWDRFLLVLRQSVDEKKYRKNLEKLLDEMEADSIEAATDRVLSMRSGKEAPLRYAEAKQRLQNQRLARELAQVSEMLRQSPTGPEAKQAVAALDKHLHATLA